MEIKKVITEGFCVGCGVCAVLSDKISIQLDNNGQYSANLSNEISENNIDNICPFSNKSKNEDDLSKDFLSPNLKYKKHLGKYLTNYAGYVLNNEQRETSSSGGILSWLLIKLLENKDIDGIIHVGNFENNEILMGYKISFTIQDILNNRKSRYYPVEMSTVLKEIKEKYPNKKFAVVGIPCFIKSIRLLQESDNFYKEQIKYTIGIVCGHLKNKYFAESYGFQEGIKPENLKKIDFRYYQDSDKYASDYSVKLTEQKVNKNERIIIKNNNDFYASNWGHGMFKYKSCEYCDDVLAETADIVFGDAWLPKYNDDSRGTNVITVRNLHLDNLIKNNNQELYLETLKPEEVLLSQDGGIRHRTEGLSYRLYKLKRKKKWIPKKRVEPSNKNINKNRKKIYTLREIISFKSTEYFIIGLSKNEFKFFKNKLDVYINRYNNLYKQNKTDLLLPIKKIYWRLNKILRS